jgi:hypothetical protein
MQTQLVIRNASKKPVTVWITLGATPGCLQDVTQIPYVTSGTGLVGSFVLNSKQVTAAYAPAVLGFNANLSFNTQPLNCPCDAMPYGVNLFEFIINNGFQPAGSQETVDISCVAGVNCIIMAELSGATWNAGPTQPNVTKIQNGVPPTNTGKVGVYPFGCDTCTSITAPPSCPSQPWPYETPQTDAICNVQRDATGPCGGIVKVTYLGPALFPC